MSYNIHAVIRNESGDWRRAENYATYSLGCLADFKNAWEYLHDQVEDQLSHGETFGVCFQIRSTLNPGLQTVLESKLHMKGDINHLSPSETNWVSSSTFSAAPIISADDDMDYVHYVLLPYRLVCERPDSIELMLRRFPLDQLRSFTPRKVKAIWFAANLIRRENGMIQAFGGYHQSNYSRVRASSEHVSITPGMASAMINADAYYRRRIGKVDVDNSPIEAQSYMINDRDVPFDLDHRMVTLKQLQRQPISGTPLWDHMIRVYYCIWDIILGKFQVTGGEVVGPTRETPLPVSNRGLYVVTPSFRIGYLRNLQQQQERRAA